MPKSLLIIITLSNSILLTLIIFWIFNKNCAGCQAELTRHNSLKDWEKQQSIINQLNKELDQTLDQASDELITNDQEISSLRTKINRLKTAKEQLEKDLKLEQKKKGTDPNPLNSTDNFLPYSLYFLLAIWLVLLLTNPDQENLWPKKL